jgi:putative ABC transport system permease protein
MMLKNYLKIALRTLWKNKLFSFINIFGLALSMSVGVILFIELKANNDTDHFHPKLNQIFRVQTQETTNNKQSTWATTPLPMASQLKNIDFVEKTVSVRHGGNANLQTEKGDIPIDITFTESSFFGVFGFKLLSGNANSLDKKPSSVFISEKTAIKIFGKENPLGRTLIFENLGTYTVAGVIQTPPLETHLPIEAMLSLANAESLEKKGLLNRLTQNWNEYKNSSVYARLNSENQYQNLKKALQQYDRTFENVKLKFTAQPVEEITPWNPSIINDKHAGINNSGILTNLFLIVALTLLSAFNYVSLSLARALARSREVGIRKAAGATRIQIIKQFLFEATIISFFALLITFPFVDILRFVMPSSGRAFNVDIITILGLLFYAIITGLVAGVIPAWILSSFQPIQVLRKMKNIRLLRGVSIYKFLIVVQFGVTIMLMVFFVILRDFTNKNEATIASIVPPNVLTIDLKGESFTTIQNEIKQLSQVEDVLATNWYYDAFYMKQCQLKTTDKIHEISYVSIDPRTIETEQIKLKSGRNFPKNMPENIEQFVLLNESALRLISPKNSNILGSNVTIDSINVQILGIMPDQIVGRAFPIIYRYLPKEIVSLTVKIKPNSEQSVTKACQKIWKNNFPQKTLNILNLKERYSSENSWEMLSFFGFFSGLVMIIACMGILGISSYSVQVRTKELGIRKVLGASSFRLVWKISKNFAFLLVLGGTFGIPAGWFCGSMLRSRMGNKVDLGPYNLLIAFGLVCVVGMITVLSQTIRAGQINPAKVLKVD